MDLKAALTGKDRKAILNSCEYGEDNAKATYEEAIEDGKEHLSAAQQSMIVSQKSLLRADHNHIKALRDALLEA